MILLIDNYDSFVFNLSRYLCELGVETKVCRNDALSVKNIKELQPAAIIISPGPCTPHEAGISIELVQQLGPHIPVLGVCLGHQALAVAYGGEVIRAPRPVHGKTSLIDHSDSPLFRDLPKPFRAMRYHSLVVNEQNLPTELEVIAQGDGLIMGLKHRSHPVWGVQFHPESILTEGGHQLLHNFLSLAGVPSSFVPAGDLTATLDFPLDGSADTDFPSGHLAIHW
jgi:anthranilate synthase/aminodeoxychorismate synthase-like glutamine amidotransferase